MLSAFIAASSSPSGSIRRCTNQHRAEELKLQVSAVKSNAGVNSGEARKRPDLLKGRLHKRLQDLNLETPR
jgi:hypothetical protein